VRSSAPIGAGAWQNQLIGGEPRDGRVCVLCGNLVFPNEPVGQLAIDFELDRNEIVTAELTRTARGCERGNRRQALFTAQRFARGADDGLRRRRLGTSHGRLTNYQMGNEDAVHRIDAKSRRGAPRGATRISWMDRCES
jgi:hypothetical protein